MNIGSNFDDFLREEGLLEVSEAAAAKRVIAFQIAQEMERCRLSKTESVSRTSSSPSDGLSRIDRSRKVPSPHGRY